MADINRTCLSEIGQGMEGGALVFFVDDIKLFTTGMRTS